MTEVVAEVDISYGSCQIDGFNLRCSDESLRKIHSIGHVKTILALSIIEFLVELKLNCFFTSHNHWFWYLVTVMYATLRNYKRKVICESSRDNRKCDIGIYCPSDRRILEVFCQVAGLLELLCTIMQSWGDNFNG
jgi:hypothetical protein